MESKRAAKERLSVAILAPKQLTRRLRSVPSCAIAAEPLFGREIEPATKGYGDS